MENFFHPLQSQLFQPLQSAKIQTKSLFSASLFQARSHSCCHLLHQRPFSQASLNNQRAPLTLRPPHSQCHRPPRPAPPLPPPAHQKHLDRPSLPPRVKSQQAQYQQEVRQLFFQRHQPTRSQQLQLSQVPQAPSQAPPPTARLPPLPPQEALLPPQARPQPHPSRLHQVRHQVSPHQLSIRNAQSRHLISTTTRTL